MTGRPFVPVLMEILDLPGTSPIERQPARRNRKVGRNKKESTKKEKIEHSERLCVTIRRDLSKK